MGFEGPTTTTYSKATYSSTNHIPAARSEQARSSGVAKLRKRWYHFYGVSGKNNLLVCGYSSVVEHLVANENVARSNRVTRSSPPDRAVWFDVLIQDIPLHPLKLLRSSCVQKKQAAPKAVRWLHSIYRKERESNPR